METKAKKRNQNKSDQFDAVQFMRKQRNELSKKLSKMTKAEIIEYFKKKGIENTVKPSK